MLEATVVEPLEPLHFDLSQKLTTTGGLELELGMAATVAAPGQFDAQSSSLSESIWISASQGVLEIGI